MKPKIVPPSWQRTLYIAAFVQFVSAVGFSSVFPFFPLYVKALGTNTHLSLEFWIGIVFSVQGLSMMIASPIWGTVADRYGRKMMVARATYGGAVLILMMGFVRSAEELAFLRLLQGFVTGVVSAISALVAASTPREQTGYAMGMVQMALWSGVAAGPLIGGVLADYWGFRAAFMVTAVLLLIAGLLVTFGIQEVFEPKSRPSTRSAAGFLSDWRQILTAPGIVLIYSARTMLFLGRTMIVPILPLYALYILPDLVQIGTFTGLAIGLAAGAGTISAIYLGRLGDRIGHQPVLVASALGGTLFYLMQVFSTQSWQLLLLYTLGGAALGGVMPAISALLSRYTLPGQEGAAFGLDNSVGAAARGVAPLIGSGVAVWAGLPATFIVAGLCFLVIAGLALRGLSDKQPTPV